MVGYFCILLDQYTHPLLVLAAERAVQKWKWEPAGHESNEAIELRFNPE